MIRYQCDRCQRLDDGNAVGQQRNGYPEGWRPLTDMYGTVSVLLCQPCAEDLDNFLRPGKVVSVLDFYVSVDDFLRPGKVQR